MTAVGRPGDVPQGLLTGLRDVVGRDHLLTDPDLTSTYASDWTGRFAGVPAAVVRPAGLDEVREVVALCRRSGAPVVPQGGNTGLVGGGTPRGHGMVVVSTRRLDATEPVDVDARQVTVGAGVTVAALRRHAQGRGLDYGVDLASRDSATVGGTIATNAGGVRVVLHGDTRAQVVGVEAVLGDGRVVSHLAGLPKDSAGYDLSGLLVGSEGTLGIVTRARVRLVDPLPQTRATALVGVPDVRSALEIVRQQRRVLAAEFVVGDALRVVCEATGLTFPLRRSWPLYLLVETEDEPRLPVQADVDAVVDRRVWAYRERQTEAIGTLGVVHKLDVAVPLGRLQELLDALPDVTAPFAVLAFGHLAEGNVHVEVVGAQPDDEAPDEAVLTLVSRLGGTVSAEHGVGVAKARWLALSRSRDEVAVMRSVKDALDPDGLMNPGVLFD
ncbi:MAG: FAD-binding oxidoreductase [Actinomycetes bacterium]